MKRDRRYIIASIGVVIGLLRLIYKLDRSRDPTRARREPMGA